jgi:ribosomal protein S18 acetylase RimI-like enzyme
MIVHTLSSTSIAELVQVFNASFKDYFLPIEFTDETLSNKIKSENIFLDYSVGVSINNQLVAFILTGIDSEDNKMLSYNAGTGVIPEFRGQHLPQLMYDFLLPLVNKNNIKKHVLEVITQNQKAIKIYQTIGYQITKKVVCFKGIITQPKPPFAYQIFEFDFVSKTTVSLFWNHKPTYQNTLSCINRNKNEHTFLGVFSENGLLGYVIYQKSNSRIKQFGVDKNYRRSSIGHHLFYEIQKTSQTQEVSLINIDVKDTETIAFLEKIGLSVTVEQFEMILQQ